MKRQCRRPVFAWLFAGWLCLLVACTPAAVDESAADTEPADTSASGSAPPGEQTDAKPQDIIDRMFSPLDDAVSDINRDLNKGATDPASGPDE